MDIRKEDVEILDTVLDALSEGKSVDSSFLIRSGIVQINLKQIGYAKKEAEIILESLNLYIACYCGLVTEKGSIGSGVYLFVKDHRTLIFKQEGGFRYLFEKQQDKKEKSKANDNLLMEINRLSSENLKLQKEELIYNKKIRFQNSIIRIWQAVSAVLGLASLLLYFFKH